MNTNLIGTITVSKNGNPCKNTANHAKFLTDRGYQVETVGEKLQVKVTGFIEKVNLSTPEGVEELKQAVKDQKAMTYRTQITFPDGKEMKSVLAAARLDREIQPGLSAIMMVDASYVAPAKAARPAPVGLGI
jgi:hypothetical protein